MAGYRKLGRTSSQRKALLRIQATNLLYHGKIVTTEARAKEVRKIVESLIALAVKEKDNFETKYKTLVPYYIAEIYTQLKNYDKAQIVAQNYLSAYQIGRASCRERV